MTKLKVVAGAPNEIIMEREFDAPRHLVMRAMREPELIKRWLGGKRAVVSSAEVDYRVGGKYRYVFDLPDGGSFSFSGVYKEISDTHTVHTEQFNDQPGGSVATATYTETNGKTRLRVVVAFDTAELRDLVAATGMTDGAGESYDCLEQVLRAIT